MRSTILIVFLLSIFFTLAESLPTSQQQAKTTDATSSSCARNQEAIFGVLEKYLPHSKNLLEVGSGTGDHAVYFGQRLQNLTWQTSDVMFYHPHIIATLNESRRNLERVENVLDPIQLDIEKDEIEPNKYDALFTSNTLHCMTLEQMETFFQKAGRSLKSEALFIVYGPFNLVNDQFTSEGNRNFNTKLKEQDPRLGIRNLHDVQEVASKAGFKFIARHDHTAANNYILIFQRDE